MLVLHFLQSDSFSGAENVACQIIKLFENDKNIKMIYSSKDGKISDTLKEKQIFFAPMKKLSYFDFKKIIKKYNPDIIHCHDVGASVKVALAKKKNIKLISHIHGNHPFMNKKSIKSYLYYLLSKRYNEIIWVSDSCFDNFVFKEKLREKSTVLYNVVDMEKLYSNKNLDNKKYKYDVVFVGRLSEPKDPLRLIDVMNLVVEKNSSATFAIVGDGEFYNEVKEKIEKLSLTENIHLLGRMNNPMKILADSKCMLMTSKHEGLPMCVLEAITFGVPIVSTPTDGTKYLIENYDIGFISNDNVELSNYINDIINMDKKSLEKRKKEIINSSLKINDINNYKKVIQDIYKK